MAKYKLKNNISVVPRGIFELTIVSQLLVATIKVSMTTILKSFTICTMPR